MPIKLVLTETKENVYIDRSSVHVFIAALSSKGQRWPVVFEFNSGGLKAETAVMAEDHGCFLTSSAILVY